MYVDHYENILLLRTIDEYGLHKYLETSVREYVKYVRDKCCDENFRNEMEYTSYFLFSLKIFFFIENYLDLNVENALSIFL